MEVRILFWYDDLQLGHLNSDVTLPNNLLLDEMSVIGLKLLLYFRFNLLVGSADWLALVASLTASPLPLALKMLSYLFIYVS